jgi:hypothetical protein
MLSLEGKASAIACALLGDLERRIGSQLVGDVGAAVTLGEPPRAFVVREALAAAILEANRLTIFDVEHQVDAITLFSFR